MHHAIEKIAPLYTWEVAGEGAKEWDAPIFEPSSQYLGVILNPSHPHFNHPMPLSPPYPGPSWLWNYPGPSWGVPQPRRAAVLIECVGG